MKPRDMVRLVRAVVAAERKRVAAFDKLRAAERAAERDMQRAKDALGRAIQAAAGVSDDLPF